MQGVQNFNNNNKHYEEIDDDQCCVVDGDVSAKRTQILFTSHNVMKNLIGTDELGFCSDDTCKLDLSGCQIAVMGVAGKQQKFHPVDFAFRSHGDEAMFHWGHKHLKEESSEKCGVALTPWRSMNDCCICMFNSLGLVFPTSRLG